MQEIKPAVSALGKIEIAFDKLKLREQQLLFISIPATIVFVAFLLFIEPEFKNTQMLDKQVDRMHKQLALAEQGTQELLSQASVDPSTGVKQQIKSLEAQLLKLNKASEGELNQLVSPSAMPILLEELFEQADDLALVSMQSVKPDILFGDTSNSEQAPIYKHGMQITFEGSFFATRDFLSSAENLGWKLYWQDLNYTVDKHPNATTTLSLFTLSTSEAFIGVN